MNQSKIVIYMATYNGQRYLAEQLDSIVSQTHTNWELWVSDDGSEDNTIEILKNYQQGFSNNRMFIESGPRNGYAANFFSLIHKEAGNGSYYAFADQDDIWEPNKLQHAIAWLNTIPAERPALYCSRTILVNEHLKNIGYSPLFKKTPNFLNAMVQNVGGGNTMVFNHSALKLLRETNAKIPLVSHDWWTYILVSGADGAVFYDAYPLVRYRQHNANLIGKNTGWKARLNRLKLLFKGSFKNWIDMNTEALCAMPNVLTPNNRSILNQFILAKNSSFIPRMIKMSKIGLYRQTFLGNIGLIIGTLFKKI